MGALGVGGPPRPWWSSLKSRQMLRTHLAMPGAASIPQAVRRNGGLRCRRSPSALAVFAAAAGCWLAAQCFVAGGRAVLRARPAGEFAASLRAEKKNKQRLSLQEALERAKEEKSPKGDKKEEAKLSPEATFWEGPPSSTELFAPFLSCFAVIGIIPFIAAMNRQFRVKYKITDRRISVSGGFDGKDVTEFSYQEVYEIKYGLRWLGYCADMRINLRDGAKVELFGLLNFEDNYQYILERLEKDAKKRSDGPPNLRK
eukprot:CAMPEP_0115117558 /NCGR_PEP_ID=MMETSP0227-20121206/43961_1 /TAXON_ID=89957 /ORGANISM="Polarella glacialis, Strain CCMP 1383" /LENGTH=256 /DNA_ID=CAMNT_0002518647 /DNA_START=129 /DNA_END=899 /DNA_ORIENTATION=-